MSFKYLLSQVDMTDFANDSIQDEEIMHQRRIVRGAWMAAENDVLHAALNNHRPLRNLHALSSEIILLDTIKTVDEFRQERVSEEDIKLYVRYYGKALDDLIEKYEKESLSPDEALERIREMKATA